MLSSGTTHPRRSSAPAKTNLTPASSQHNRERRRPDITEEDLNDDDVSVDDRLDVASLGDGSDDEILESPDDDVESPFSRDVILPPVNHANDVSLEQRGSRSQLFDDQVVGSFIFTNQVCHSVTFSLFNNIKHCLRRRYASLCLCDCINVINCLTRQLLVVYRKRNRTALLLLLCSVIFLTLRN